MTVRFETPPANVIRAKLYAMFLHFVVNYCVSMLYYWLKWLTTAWGWFPISFFGIFGTFQISTTFGTSGPSCIAEILQKKQEKPTHCSHIIFANLRISNPEMCGIVAYYLLLGFRSFTIINCILGILKLWNYKTSKLWNFETHYTSQKSLQIIEHMVLVELDGTTYYLLPTTYYLLNNT